MIIIQLPKLKEAHVKSTLKIAIVLLILLASGLLYASLQDSGCVRCHTDEAVMKRLFKPPLSSVSAEGEG